jgi:hypothetical protein
LRARAFTRDGEIYLPDTPNRHPSATLAHELTHVVQQRRLGTDLPSEWTAEGRALEREAQAVEQAFHHETAPPLIHRESAPEGIQRQPELTTEPQTPEPEQQEEAPPVDEELAANRDRLLALCAQRSLNMNDAGDIGELATKLYHPLRGLLRAELLVDRERAGLLTDFR